MTKNAILKFDNMCNMAFFTFYLIFISACDNMLWIKRYEQESRSSVYVHRKKLSLAVSSFNAKKSEVHLGAVS